MNWLEFSLTMLIYGRQNINQWNRIWRFVELKYIWPPQLAIAFWIFPYFIICCCIICFVVLLFAVYTPRAYNSGYDAQSRLE